MTENPYQVLGTPIPPMLGREGLVKRIEGHLLKPSPDHVSVVGPAHYGKSVLLRHLADKHREGSSKYLTTVHIDLRRDTPDSDDAFKQRLARGIREALQPRRRDLSDILAVDDDDGDGMHELLGLVFDKLKRSDDRLLVVLDGFDYVLAGAGLTRNLWDQLRSLAQKTSLVFVTGSRRPLRELCRTEESRTSDFWEIFYDTPIRVEALDDADWAPFLAPLLDAGRTLDESARKEVANWTGGVPLLACAVLQRLWDQHGEGARLSKLEIDQAAEAMSAEPNQLLAELWDNCDVELHHDLGALADTDIPLTDLSEGRRRAIESRGFGRVSKDRLRRSCRLMQRYARERAPAVADLKRLFETAQGFDSNIRSLLELRLAQVETAGADGELREFVRNAIRDLKSSYPRMALTWKRSIANRALALIWEAELPPDKTLPAEWIKEWRYPKLHSLLDDGEKLPHEAGKQCQVLRLITGSRQIRRQSRYVTRTTCLLVDHLKSVGDFGQHPEDDPEATVSIGVATAFVFAAISLVESLTADLRRQGTGETHPAIPRR